LYQLPEGASWRVAGDHRQSAALEVIKVITGCRETYPGRFYILMR